MFFINALDSISKQCWTTMSSPKQLPPIDIKGYDAKFKIPTDGINIAVDLKFVPLRLGGIIRFGCENPNDFVL